MDDMAVLNIMINGPTHEDRLAALSELTNRIWKYPVNKEICIIKGGLQTLSLYKSTQQERQNKAREVIKRFGFTVTGLQLEEDNVHEDE